MEWPWRKRESDLERELRADLKLEAAEQRERGLTEEEARAAARRACDPLSAFTGRGGAEKRAEQQAGDRANCVWPEVERGGKRSDACFAVLRVRAVLASQAAMSKTGPRRP